MRKAGLLVAALLLSTTTIFAQQDPDDPGVQDSVILLCQDDHADSSDTYQVRVLHEILLTDDTAYYFNVPLRWFAPMGGIGIERGSTWWPPYGCDRPTDTVFTDQNWVRQFYGADHADCPPLFTNGVRQYWKSLRVIISPNIPSQLVVFDTCFDPVVGPVAFSNELGDIEITPGVQRTFLSIGAVGIGDGIIAPGQFTLPQNYPNPFNTQTTICYSLPEPGPVSLEIYDIKGEKVAALYEGIREAGEHKVVWDAASAPSGVYFYRVSAASFVETKRMVLLK